MYFQLNFTHPPVIVRLNGRRPLTEDDLCNPVFDVLRYSKYITDSKYTKGEKGYKRKNLMTMSCLEPLIPAKDHKYMQYVYSFPLVAQYDVLPSGAHNQCH